MDRISILLTSLNKSSCFLNMPSVALDQAENPLPNFESILASRIPLGFLTSLRPMIEASYEVAYHGIPVPEGSLPYINNLAPHHRNRLVFEHLHEVAEAQGMTATAACLDNGYFYLETEYKGLTLHIKHFDNYKPLAEQMVGANYRREMTSLNMPLGQLPLFTEGKPMVVPDQLYVILFYQDGAKRNEVGDIFFILPSNEKGNSLAYSKIETVIASSLPSPQAEKKPSDDSIDLPSKREDDEEEQAK